MRRTLLTILLAAICAVTSCIKENLANITDITLDRTSAELNLGDTLQLGVSISPVDAQNYGLRWSTTDPKVAIVTDGLVRTLSTGDVTIVVTSVYGGATATCSIKVKAPVKGIYLDKHEVELYEGESAELKASVNTADVHVKTVNWSSSSEVLKVVGSNGITTISDDGISRIVSTGTLMAKQVTTGCDTVTVVVASGDGSASDSCKVIVKCHVSGIALDRTELVLNEGESFTLPLSLYPVRATNKSCNWTSESPEVASVDENGCITAHMAGTAKVMVKSEDGGFTAVCNVTVNRSVTGISIWKDGSRLLDTLTLVSGAKCTLIAKLEPEGASNPSFIWKSSNESVAEITSEGILSALKTGYSALTVISNDGIKTASCNLNVVSNVTGMVICYPSGVPVTSLKMRKGDELVLSAVVSPEGATAPEITWTSTENSVLTVDDNGKVKAVGKGTATVIASLAGGTKVAFCAITVNVPVTGIQLDKTSSELYVGDCDVLKATVYPVDATDVELEWSSNKPDDVTVSEDGYIKVLKKSSNGEKVLITVKTDNFSAVCTVSVKEHVTDVELDKSYLSLQKGNSATLTATCKPALADDKTVTWTSDNTGVATVSGGNIRTYAAGTAIITATSKDGEHKAKCTVVVTDNTQPGTVSVQSITLAEHQITMDNGSTRTLGYTITPTNATNKNVTWSSSDNSVVSVTNGTLTAKSDGTAEITVTTVDGQKTDKCTVTVQTVQVEVTSVSFDPTSKTIENESSFKITATVYPSNATDKTLAWSSNNESCCTVSQDGTVTAKSTGTATITATSTNGKIATCTVTVIDKIIHVTSVVIEQRSVTLHPGEKYQLTCKVLPENATDKRVIWGTGSPSLTIDNGLVTALKISPAIVTVRSVDSGKSDQCIITIVEQKLEKLSIDKTAVTMKVGETLTLYPVFTPVNVTKVATTWKSNNTGIVSVTDGKLTANAAGQTTVTVTSGGLTATCYITVQDAAPTGSSTQNVGFDTL